MIFKLAGWLRIFLKKKQEKNNTSESVVSITKILKNNFRKKNWLKNKY